ncbi:hypothetical protein KHP57_16930, partial [Algiphilus sp. NNCM1]|nr:hypothetical protein [Algiphilus acroporae]
MHDFPHIRRPIFRRQVTSVISSTIRPQSTSAIAALPTAILEIACRQPHPYCRLYFSFTHVS